MAKKSGGGGVGLVLLIGAIALLASIPKVVWITLVIVAAIGAVLYVFSQNKSKTEKPWNSTPIPSGGFSQAVAEPRRRGVAGRQG